VGGLMTMRCKCEQLVGSHIEAAPGCLKDFWIFHELNKKEIEALSTAAMRRKAPKGHHLFSQGDEANEMFLIKWGRVRLFKLMVDGTEITLDIRKAGDILGENVFSEEIQYPVNAACMEDTFTCGFNTAQFESLVTAYPNIGLRIIRNLSARIRWLTSQVGSMSVSNIEERLYRVMQNIAKEHGAETPMGLEIPFLMTHEELGFLIGAHRVSVTRALSALKRSGKLMVAGKNWVFPAATPPQ
jgi:CRP/FNR family transcriptional regulator